MQCASAIKSTSDLLTPGQSLSHTWLILVGVSPKSKEFPVGDNAIGLIPTSCISSCRPHLGHRINIAPCSKRYATMSQNHLKINNGQWHLSNCCVSQPA